jgi:hypothetical protein
MNKFITDCSHEWRCKPCMESVDICSCRHEGHSARGYPCRRDTGTSITVFSMSLVASRVSTAPTAIAMFTFLDIATVNALCAPSRRLDSKKKCRVGLGRGPCVRHARIRDEPAYLMLTGTDRIQEVVLRKGISHIFTSL